MGCIGWTVIVDLTSLRWTWTTSKRNKRTETQRQRRPRRWRLRFFPVGRPLIFTEFRIFLVPPVSGAVCGATYNIGPLVITYKTKTNSWACLGCFISIYMMSSLCVKQNKTTSADRSRLPVRWLLPTYIFVYFQISSTFCPFVLIKPAM